MEKTYFVVNTVRARHNRLARFQAPERHRFKQFILGGSKRLVRGRPVPITEAQLQEHYAELEEKSISGALEVHCDAPYGPLFIFGEKAEAPKKEEKKPEPEVVEKAPEPEPEPEPEKLPEPEEVPEEEEEPPPPPPPPAKKNAKKGGRKKKKG